MVASLARPEGNATGINFLTSELVSKRLGLLRELVPAANRVAALVNPTNVSSTEGTLRDLESVAQATGLQVDIFYAGTRQEIDAVFAILVRGRHDALFVGADPFFSSRRVQLVNLAMRHAIPTAFSNREFGRDRWLSQLRYQRCGCVASVGYICRSNPQGGQTWGLPVVQASKFELVINAQTARMLGLTVSPSLLARADEVIE